MPVWAEFCATEFTRQSDLTPLAVLRCCLVSSIAAVSPTDEIKTAAANAAGSAGSTDVTASAGDARASSVAAAYAAAADAANANAAYTAARAAGAAGASVWEAIKNDVKAVESGAKLPSGPLWPETNPLLETWITSSIPWHQSGSPYEFWHRWYEEVLQGRRAPLGDEQVVGGRWRLGSISFSEDLLYKIALIPNETWDAGPEAVAQAIREIEAEFRIAELIRENPHAWRIEFDARVGKLDAKPVEKRDLSQVVGELRRSLRDFGSRCRRDQSGNRLGEQIKSAFELPIKDLRRDIKRHSDALYSLMVSIEAAHKELTKLARRSGFEQESAVERLLDALGSHAEDICVAAPEVVEQLRKKSDVRYELASAEKLRNASRLVFGLHLDAEGILKTYALEAARVIQDDDASPEERKAAWYFVQSVLPRAAQACLDNPEQVEVGKKKSVAKRAVEVADGLNKLDKGVDALQENVPEAFGWLQDLMQQLGNVDPSSLNWPF